jgi:uncharacterized protein YdiU (UPF0061 family)
LSWPGFFASGLLHWWPIGFGLGTARVILIVTTAPLAALPSTMDHLDSVKFSTLGFNHGLAVVNTFSFFNQPAQQKRITICFGRRSDRLLAKESEALEQLDQIRQGFAEAMQKQIKKMWAAKLGLTDDHPKLLKQLMQLLTQSEVDYTIFFRELSHVPEKVSALKKSFYGKISQQLDEQWQSWLKAGTTSLLKAAMWLRYRQR